MISVFPVTEKQQFIACLDLRFKTYSELGFVNPNLGSDLDRFDWSSFHFMALDENGTLAGTVRLILPVEDRLPNSPEFAAGAHWCSQIQQEHELHISKSRSIPILETLRDNDLPRSALQAAKPAELSRIIVAPGFRGRGGARALGRAVVAKAEAIGRDVLFLQCLPTHVDLFQKLEFEFVCQSLHYSHLTVPDRVVAMKRCLH